MTQEAEQYITKIWKCLSEFAKSSVTLQMCALHTHLCVAYWPTCHTWNNRILILTLHQFHFTVVAKTPVELFHKSTLWGWTNAHSSLISQQELFFIITHISSLIFHCTQEFPLFLCYFKLSGTDCLFILFQSLILDISAKCESEIIIVFRECLYKVEAIT